MLVCELYNNTKDPHAECWQDAPHIQRKVNRVLVRPGMETF